MYLYCAQVEPAPTDVRMLWSDSGASGRPGSIWAIGQLQLLAAALGQAPPVDASWRLKRDRFTLADADMRAPASAPPPPGEPHSFQVGLELESGCAPAAPKGGRVALERGSLQAGSSLGAKLHRPSVDPQRTSGVPAHGGGPPPSRGEPAEPAWTVAE